jgi:hypothetical protein
MQKNSLKGLHIVIAGLIELLALHGLSRVEDEGLGNTATKSIPRIPACAIQLGFISYPNNDIRGS